MTTEETTEVTTSKNLTVAVTPEQQSIRVALCGQCSGLGCGDCCGTGLAPRYVQPACCCNAPAHGATVHDLACDTRRP